MDGEKKRILFVCLGNICRSPAAEGLFADYVTAAGYADQVEIDSAGTGGWHRGELADPRMRRAASNRGCELTSRARQVQVADFTRFDLIVAMDRENLANLQRLRGQKARQLPLIGDTRAGEVRLLSEFLPAGWPQDVPDPYYGGDEGFEQVLDMLSAACPALLEALLAERGPEP
jgi:protein-tyrosine phosphatase